MSKRCPLHCNTIPRSSASARHRFCVTPFSFHSDLSRRPEEDTHPGVLFVCLYNFCRPYKFSTSSSLRQVAPCPQASSRRVRPRPQAFVTLSPTPRSAAAAALVLLFVKFLLDIYRQFPQPLPRCRFLRSTSCRSHR